MLACGSGELTARGHMSMNGVAVDTLALTDDGRWLLVGSTLPGSVRTLAVDPCSGALSPVWGKPGFGPSSVVEGLLGASSIVIAMDAAAAAAAAAAADDMSDSSPRPRL